MFLRARGGSFVHEIVTLGLVLLFPVLLKSLSRFNHRRSRYLLHPATVGDEPGKIRYTIQKASGAPR